MNNENIKARLYEIIFGTDTPAGKRFDVALIVVILLSVLLLMIESLDIIPAPYARYVRWLEWLFTVLFTIEYSVRIYCSPAKFAYIGSFYGLVDMISVLPSYLALIFPGANVLLIVRIMRFLRIFRVLKLVRYLTEANTLTRSIMQARRKILVFFFAVLVLATIFGSLMYLVEGPASGFSSIPKSIYWTIVTLTTVGYGDITPHTALGQFIAAIAMLLGYSIIAVPTGILTAELAQEMRQERAAKRCQRCQRTGHDSDALWCKYCGASIATGDDTK